MANLNPVVLDVVITKITKKTVYYKLALNQEEESWRIPVGSKFDTSQLVVGQRYRVTSQTIKAYVWVYKKRKHVYQDRFDWLCATAIAPKAKLQAHSAKQREISEALAAMPLADNGSLFSW